MKPMLKSTETLLLVRNVLGLLLICLIATALSGCAGLRKFPATYIYEYDRKAGVCGQYQIVETRPKLQFKHIKDQPVSWCGGMFGFSDQDIAKVLDWADEAADYASKKCR